jgi:hypothetical protein
MTNNLRWKQVDMRSDEQTQETLALLKILAIGEKQIAAEQTFPVADLIGELRSRRLTTEAPIVGRGGRGARTKKQ